jgi:hypothetical protein
LDEVGAFDLFFLNAVIAFAGRIYSKIERNQREIH